MTLEKLALGANDRALAPSSGGRVNPLWLFCRSATHHSNADPFLTDVFLVVRVLLGAGIDRFRPTVTPLSDDFPDIGDFGEIEIKYAIFRGTMPEKRRSV